MRILHLIHDYHPAVGGSELIVRRLSEGLVERGHEVFVVCSNASKPDDFVYGARAPLPVERVAHAGVEVQRLAYRRLPRWLRPVYDAGAVAWWSRRWPGYGRVKALWCGPHLRRLERTVFDIDPDLIFSATVPFLHMWQGESLARRLKVPWVCMPCLHTDDAWVMDNPSMVSLLARADHLFVLTEYEATMLRALGANPTSSVLGGGVDLERRKCADLTLRQRFGLGDQPLVLFLGRLEEGKGVVQVLEAMSELWRGGSEAVLVLAGGSTRFSREELAGHLEALPERARSRVLLRTDIEESEKWGWLEQCSLLAHPSRVDSFGIVLLEAWACEKPVIAARTGPQLSVVGPEEGCLVRVGDSEELAIEIARLIAAPSLAAAMGAAGRAKVEDRYTWDRLVDHAESIYRSLAAA